MSSWRYCSIRQSYVVVVAERVPAMCETLLLTAGSRLLAPTRPSSSSSSCRLTAACLLLLLCDGGAAAAATISHQLK